MVSLLGVVDINFNMDVYASKLKPDCSDIPLGPAFGRYSEKAHSGYENTLGGVFKRDMSSWSLDYERKNNRNAFKAKVMGYVPLLGTYVAHERVSRVKNNDMMTSREKIANYIRAFFEAIPLLGLLVLCPLDIATDKYREHQAKKVTILSHNS